MKKLSFLTFLFLYFAFANALFAQTSELLTFDDLPGASSSGPFLYVPAGYGGLQWYNFCPLNGTDWPGASGYKNGVVSPDNVIFTPYGTSGSFSSTTGFDLNYAYLTAAWNNGMQVEVEGFAGDILTYDNTYTVNATGPELINFDYLDVTSVDFITSGGVNAGFLNGGNGTQLVMDNLSVTIIPETSTLRLMLLGFVVVVLGKRKSKAVR